MKPRAATSRSSGGIPVAQATQSSRSATGPEPPAAFADHSPSSASRTSRSGTARLVT